MEFYTVGLGESAVPDTFIPTELLGGKGAGLVWMSQQGVPVPPGFIIPTTVWADYDKKPKTTLKAIAKALPAYLAQLDNHFGYRPLVSVRSGARVSCPGMMDTILNVGIDTKTSPAWQARLGPAAFDDSLHRLVVMYGSVVKGLDKADLKPSLSVALSEYQRQTGEDFPDAEAQLLGAIEAVFKSWDTDRAKFYRKQNAIPREWGTAVTVQAMVFGNLNDKSGTGVLFTRDPNTGAVKVTGEFLPNAQGEDVVDGSRTPLSLDAMKVWNNLFYTELTGWATTLEKAKGDVQDIEFTIGTTGGTSHPISLFILQTRNAKRSATAALRIALDLVKEGVIDAGTALSRVTPKEFDLAQVPHLDPKFKKAAQFTGIGACSGLVSGKPVFSSQDAIDCMEPCILVAKETTPNDIEGMHAAVGVLTLVGGMTSHAAVNARAMNRACIVGLGLDSTDTFQGEKVISMDGSTGRVWTGPIPIIKGESNGLIEEFERLVAKVAGIIPVIRKVPHTPLDSALLYLGTTLLDPKKAAALVSAVAEKVTGTLYLDLTPGTWDETEFYSLFTSYNPAQQVVDALDVTLADKVVLVGGANVVNGVFSVVGNGADLRSLVLTKKEVNVGGLDLTDAAVQQVLAWKQQEGLQMISIGAIIQGTKSVVSVAQVLPAVLKGV